MAGRIVDILEAIEIDGRTAGTPILARRFTNGTPR